MAAGMSEVAVYCLWEGRGVDIRDEGSGLPEREEGLCGPPLHWETPLTCSSKLSRQLGAKVWLKLDNVQPPQSYKIRGIGLLCQRVRGREGVMRKGLYCRLLFAVDSYRPPSPSSLPEIAVCPPASVHPL